MGGIATIPTKSQTVGIRASSLLTWPRGDEVPYLDILLNTGPDGKFMYRLFEEPGNLHLYLPFDTCHAPGMFWGVAMRGFERISRRVSQQGPESLRAVSDSAAHQRDPEHPMCMIRRGMHQATTPYLYSEERCQAHNLFALHCIVMLTGHCEPLASFP